MAETPYAVDESEHGTGRHLLVAPKLAGSFRELAVSGIKWSSMAHICRRTVSFVTTIILARLLTPADFGLVAMAAVVTGFVELFKDMGTGTAVVQRQNVSDTLLSSVFWMNALFGCAAMVVLLVIAPLFGIFYRELKVVAILQLLSVSFVVSALGILQQALMERRLAFETLAKLEVSSALVGSTVGIGAALSGLGAWSLVFQVLANNVVGTALLWLCAGWRPGLVFSWSEIRSVMPFSLNLTASNVFGYFIRNADNFLIGRYLGAQNLGVYDLAYRLMLYPLQGISAVTGRVMFPLYARIQHDLRRFREAYLSIAWAIAIISFPLMFGLMAIREPLVLTLFGEKWVLVKDLLLIFAPLGAIQSVATTVGSIYQAQGRTDLMLRWGAGSGALIVLAFTIGLYWGVIGVAAAYAIVSLLLLYPSFAIPFKLIGLRVTELAKVLWQSMFCSVLMAMVVVLVLLAIPDFADPGWLALSVQVAFGAVCYLTFTWFFNREQMIMLWSVLRGR